MTQENETADHQLSLPPNPQADSVPLTSTKALDPEQRETQPKSSIRPQSPQQNKKSDVKKIATFILVALVIGLGVAVYLLIKERTRAFHDFEIKLAQFESRSQTLQDKQSSALAQNDRALESLKKDLQKLREQTAEHFAAEDRVLQELRGTRSLSPLENTPLHTVLAEQNLKQAAEPSLHQESTKPVEIKPEPGRTKETQSFIDFVETVLKKGVELAGDLFIKIWDLLSDILKKPV